MELNGDAKLFELFKDSAIAKAIVGDEQKRIAAERVAVAAQIRELETRASNDFLADEKTTNELIEKHQTAKKTMLVTATALTDFTNRRMARAAQRGTQVAELHAKLSKTASPKISEFLRWLDDLFEHNRNRILEQSPVNSESLLRGGNVRKFFSNTKKVKAWVEAIVAARKAAEALLIDPDQGQVDQRLEKIRKSIPAVEALDAELVEVFPPQFIRESRPIPARDTA